MRCDWNRPVKLDPVDLSQRPCRSVCQRSPAATMLALGFALLSVAWRSGDCACHLHRLVEVEVVVALNQTTLSAMLLTANYYAVFGRSSSRSRAVVMAALIYAATEITCPYANISFRHDGGDYLQWLQFARQSLERRRRSSHVSSAAAMLV
ncbi:hypothetical protein F2P81_004197 [Scophthalmus maximus]|uniref:Uncharacterized protein n=1 Tax=Scophthalmus maximus TaxID=52904 RepID=A0A6A4TGG5_SCOMX|nr:hypothetical protein F2P81_004197 [Scophthalmus maximus]